MSNTIQYRYFHKGDNEWLADDTNKDDKEWQAEWAKINADNSPDIKVEFTEEMYINNEYGDTPEWVNVTINDSGVLPYKMARGILPALDGAKSIVFSAHFDIDISSDWGGWSMSRIEVYQDSAYLTIYAKHSTDEIELNITEQFNQAIGE